jgi:AraC-like DNA-binding protein
MGVGNVRHNWLEMKDFAFGLLTCRVGEFAFVNARTTSSTVWKEGISEDFIVITRVSEGGGLVTLMDDVMEISAGDTYALSTDQGFKCHTPLYQDISLIAIPRLRLRQLGLPEETLRPKGEFAPPDSVADILFDLFHSFALRAENGPALSRKALVSVNESITGMAAAMLEENAPATITGLSSLAKAFIDGHLRDPELTPSTVAAALHVSKRTLYRSFAGDDQTVASYIRTTRLRHAKRELDSAGGVANIRNVAERWGYASGGYFAKLFQREFGFMPSEYMRNLR